MCVSVYDCVYVWCVYVYVINYIRTSEVRKLHKTIWTNLCVYVCMYGWMYARIYVRDRKVSQFREK